MYREFYYWMYYHLKKIKTNDMPAFNSYILTCLLQGFNVGTIYVITSYFLKIDTSTDKRTSIYMGLGLAAVLFIINYFLLFAPRESIFEKFKDMSPERKSKGQIYFWLYVALSVVIFFVVGINLVPSRN